MRRFGRPLFVNIIALCMAVTPSTLRAGSVLYVDQDATGNADGSSWCHAYSFLQDALADAGLGGVQEIQVARGVYRPDQGTGQTPGDRESTFAIPGGVRLRGGFAGCGETDPAERHIEDFQTILSGDLAANDVGNRFDASRYENAYHVVTTSGVDESTELDGFFVTAGRADGVPPHDSGAGIFNDGGHPTIQQCFFFGHWALSYGGAMYNRNIANPTILQCQFYENSGDYGGAIGNDDQCSPHIENCLMTRNFVGYHGGGIYNQNQSHPTVVNCTLFDNEAYFQGGGMANFDGSNPVVEGCHFEKNRARTSVGGGMYNEQSSPSLIGVVFLENHAVLSGGGLYNSVSSPVLDHCQFLGNDARNGGGILNLQSGCVLRNCLFERNRGTMDGGAIYNLSATDVSLNNCTVVNNIAVRNGGGIYNVGSNPVIRNSILWRNEDVTGVTRNAQSQGGSGTIDYSCIQFMDVTVGTGNIHDDPLLMPGPAGCSYLGHTSAGNPLTSPCVDATTDLALEVGLDDRTTRVDEVTDSGSVDMGFHFAVTGRTCAFTNFQCEQRTNLRTVADFERCFSPANLPSDPCCAAWDLDEDGDVDWADYESMRALLSGP